MVVSRGTQGEARKLRASITDDKNTRSSSRVASVDLELYISDT